MRYKAIDGSVHVRENGKWVPCGTARSASGRDLEAFDRALNVARSQRTTREKRDA